MDSGNQFLGTERMGRLMRQYAIPCIISLLVGALYNIVDQIFIANASYLGSYGNAANTVVFPLTVVALAIAVMVGDGCCAFVSMALGRNEIDKAKRSVGNAVVLSVAGGLILTAVYLLFADSIIAMFGGTVNEETFRHSQEYFFYITLGIPFYMFGQAMNPIIHADMAFRAKRIVEVYGERKQAPEERLREKDKRRAAYHRFYTDMKWGYAQNYHLTLDSGVLGIDKCAALIAELF